MIIPNPNLQVMVHFYTSAKDLFRTVTMYAAQERDRIMDEALSAQAWYGGRFAAGHREAYMRKRQFTEERMYEDFAAKYSRPAANHPAYFYIRPDLDLAEIEKELLRRRGLGAAGSGYRLSH